MSSWQTGGQRERDNRRKNKKCNKRYIVTNTETNANSKRKLWSVRRLGRRDGQKPKKRLVERGAIEKEGWESHLHWLQELQRVGWVGLEQGLERVSSSPLPMFGVEGPMREEGLYIRI